MKKFHTLTLIAASAAFLSIGSGIAMAQTVSGGDAYAQGYAAGAAAQHQNNFNAFDTGVQAGQTQQSTTDQAYNNGYQAALAAKGGNDADQAYNNGYNDRAAEDTDTYNRAFDFGFREGAHDQARDDADLP
jgi:hypothetical protein